MDLTAYAVERKLANDGSLLNYVAKNQPVPVDVLSNSFKTLIAKRHNSAAETLVSNYPKYLRENVKMGLVPNGKNNFNVSGQINDQAIESIEAIHHVKRDSIVNNYIKDTMHTFNHDKDVHVKDIKFDNDIDQIVEQSSQPLFKNQIDNNESSDNLDLSNTDIANSQSMDEQKTLNTDFMDDSLPKSKLDKNTMLANDNQADNQVQDNHVNEVNDNQVNDNQVQDNQGQDNHANDNEVQDNQTNDNEVQDNQTNGNQANNQVQNDNTLDDDLLPKFEEPEDENTTTISRPEEFKSAYNYFINNLKEKNIDKRLPGLHI